MAAAIEPARRRLDVELVARGLVASRARGRDLVSRGLVLVDGVPAKKPGAAVGAAAHLALDARARPELVSRGAEKLAPALDAFGMTCDGAVCLDVGASTGGFTQIMLERGAKLVYAVDVGSGQLDPRLRGEGRVVSLEGMDARALDRTTILEPIDILAADVSFISLMKALPAALALTRAGSVAVLLVKPQFEVGPGVVNARGIVTDRGVQQAALATVRSWLEGLTGWRVIGSMTSPVTGGSGNTEFLLGARRHE